MDPFRIFLVIPYFGAMGGDGALPHASLDKGTDFVDAGHADKLLKLASLDGVNEDARVARG